MNHQHTAELSSPFHLQWLVFNKNIAEIAVYGQFFFFFLHHDHRSHKADIECDDIWTEVEFKTHVYQVEW